MNIQKNYTQSTSNQGMVNYRLY